MKNKNLAAQKVKQVWETKNKVEIPNTSTSDYIEIIQPIASLFSCGSFFYFTFDFSTLSMPFVSPEIKQVLGIDPEEYNLDYFFSNLEPENLREYHKMENTGFHFLMNFIQTEDIPDYKVTYLIKIKDKDGNYKTLLHQSKTIKVSKDGKVQQIFCIQTDVSHLEVTMDYSISFISQNKPSFYAVSKDPPYCFKLLKNTFTPREKEIIKMVSQGKSNKEITEHLHLSEHTIKTHRKNIIKKSGCTTTPALIAKCVREGII